MITYINDLFLTEKTAKKINKIKYDFENKKFISRICIITISEGDDVFDIIPVLNFRLNDLYKNDITVIGIAENRKAAVKLCAEMSALYLNNNSSVTMKEYYLGYLKK